MCITEKLSACKDIDIVYYSAGFIQTIEDHLSFLRQDAAIRTVVVTEHQNVKYEGDFYGLLDDCGIDKKYHQIVLRVNGFDNSSDYDGELEYFITPDFSEVEEIKSLYLTKQTD